MCTHPVLYVGLLDPHRHPVLERVEEVVPQTHRVAAKSPVQTLTDCHGKPGNINLLQPRPNFELATQLIERTLSRVRTTSGFSKESLDRLATAFTLTFKELKASLESVHSRLEPVDTVSNRVHIGGEAPAKLAILLRLGLKVIRPTSQTIDTIEQRVVLLIELRLLVRDSLQLCWIVWEIITIM